MNGVGDPSDDRIWSRVSSSISSSSFEDDEDTVALQSALSALSSS
jgi:hypothetical protein